MSISALRVWFRVFGVIYLLGGLGQGLAAFGESGKGSLGFVVGLVMVAFGASYLYVSHKFPYFLQTSTTFVQRLIYFTIGFSVLLTPFFYSEQVQAGQGMPIPIVFIIFWVLIPIYLLFNVRRIEEEHILEDD